MVVVFEKERKMETVTKELKTDALISKTIRFEGVYIFQDKLTILHI
jgi:hypothetical protein